ncbi:hypothetical protein WN944_006206 [Citrus x changshan-huyou]|uniref:Disease resistance protein winged helix domain-containing protein n=1 Tax=Citrus x changshan-huyou TaxID=2935761 RepID=A0AAP0MIT6_9ROSI
MLEFHLRLFCEMLKRVLAGEEGEAIPTVWRQFFSVMELPFHLKVCCIYLLVFPPGIEISTMQLYQLWVAEGFIPYNGEETAEHYLKELIHRGFIQFRKRSSRSDRLREFL